jgi:hypothetical protein
MTNQIGPEETANDPMIVSELGVRLGQLVEACRNLTGKKEEVLRVLSCCCWVLELVGCEIKGPDQETLKDE